MLTWTRLLTERKETNRAGWDLTANRREWTRTDGRSMTWGTIDLRKACPACANSRESHVAKRLECAASRRYVLAWAKYVSDVQIKSAGMRRTPNALRGSVATLPHCALLWQFSYRSSFGAKPRRRQFSVMTRGTRKFCKYSRPPAFVPPPDILKPPNGWRSTMAPVMVRLM